MHIERIHKMIEKLTECALCEIEKGIECVNTEEMGEVIDMIKDLAEAEYHSLISKEMKKYEEEEEEEEKYFLRMLKEEHKDDYKRMREEYGDSEETDRRFYDAWRYKSTGRYAPKGRGTKVGRRGYIEPPYWHMMPEHMMRDRMMPDYDDAERYRDMDRLTHGKMYYTDPVRHVEKTDDMRKVGDNHDVKQESKMERARRFYTEAKMSDDGTPEHKKKAMESLDHYMRELADDMSDLVSGMDASEKTMLKSKLQGLMQKIQ